MCGPPRSAAVLWAGLLLFQQPPAFRSGVSYIEVNAVVTDRSGQFVRGLTRDDFAVFEDGKRQELTVASLINLPRDYPSSGSEGAAAPPTSSGPKGQGAGSQRESNYKRIYLIVLDVMHVDPLRTPVFRRWAREFLEQYLGPRDLAGVAQIGYSQGTQTFTHDTTALVRSVEGAIGEKTGSEAVAKANADPDLLASGVRADLAAPTRKYMAERTVFELAMLADSMAAIDAPRKALVLFSEGLDEDVIDPKNTELLEQIRHLYASAARSNVTIYAVDPSGVASVGDDLNRVGILRKGATPPTNLMYRDRRIAENSLRNFAEETGGLAWVDSADFPRGFTHIVDDNSTYYLLGYYSSNPSHEKKFRTLRVRVNRSGVSVRARKGYYAG